MAILIACEESQVVCTAFRKLGFEAFSCDIEPCSGNHPEYHIQDNVVNLLRESWDLVISFPPCTHLAVSGARYFAQKRLDGRQRRGIEFFMEFTKLACPWAIENPVGIMSTIYRKPDQIIQPYEFGHLERKSTCLWLNSLPALIPTNNVYEQMMSMNKKDWDWRRNIPPSADRAKIRSKTFPGIADAIASQWSKVL